MPPTYLKLVSDRSRNAETPTHHFEPIQTPLLPIKDRTLAICTADGLDEGVFVSLMQNLHPSMVVDFRTTPRFDFGSFNRRRAFDLFESVGTQYRDFQHSPKQLTREADPMADAIFRVAAAANPKSHSASVLALVDPDVEFERAGVTAVQRLRQETKGAWELLLFGPIEHDEAPRDVIFISHANPEDNEFVLWLQIQLTRLGYETWADVTALKGGEIFWDTIEHIVRHRAVRVIVVISRRSVNKPNVLDEVSLAISVERTRQISGFVIPVRVDDIPFSELRANMARKNVLDFFSHGWANGLSQLAETLAHDKVRRARKDESLSLGRWWADQRPPTLSIVRKPEALQSNQFRVTSLPERIYTYSGIPPATHGQAWLVPFRDQWLSFMSPEELCRGDLVELRRESVMAATDVFAGNIPLTSLMNPGSRQRLLHRMLNKHWESFLLSRGLRLYRETGVQATPYVPDGLIPGNTVQFIDHDGSSRRRIVVGHSLKRNLYWHLAPLGSFTKSQEVVLSLKLRVLFSEDGQERWPTVERMRTMRRSFCKNWWNDRWRSLQCACVGWLAEGKNEIAVHAGDGGRLSLAATPMTFESPLTIEETHAQGKNFVELDLSEGVGDEEAAEWDEIEQPFDDHSSLQKW